MRMDQHIGFNPFTLAFLEENEVPEEVCECCKRPIPRDLKIIGRYEGMFGTKYSLRRHQLKDGGFADTFLQASPWSSGPMFFLGLHFQNGSTFQWSVGEIEEETSLTTAHYDSGGYDDSDIGGDYGGDDD